MKKLFLVFLLLFFFTTKAQINDNLFLIINKDNPRYRDNVDLSFLTAKIYYFDNKRNHAWSVSFNYFNKSTPDYSARYILLLPKSMLVDYQRKNKILYVKEEEKKWENMSFNDFTIHFLSRYPHYTEIYYNEADKKYITEKRYNIFMIKEEDLEKDYIPCYEVDIHLDLGR